MAGKETTLQRELHKQYSPQSGRFTRRSITLTLNRMIIAQVTTGTVWKRFPQSLRTIQNQ